MILAFFLLFPPALAVVPLILDTDMDFNVDDVGALCLAHALQDLGETELLAVVHNAGYPTAIGAVSVINHFYNRDDIPLGAFKGEFGRYVGSGYVDDLVQNWPAPVKHYDQVLCQDVKMFPVLSRRWRRQCLSSDVPWPVPTTTLWSSPPWGS